MTETLKAKIDRLKELDGKRTPEKTPYDFGWYYPEVDRMNEPRTSKSNEAVISFFQEAPAMMEVIRELERRLAVAGEALSFYASGENWKWKAKPADSDFILDCGSDVQRDFGQTARAALTATNLNQPFTEKLCRNSLKA